MKIKGKGELFQLIKFINIFQFLQGLMFGYATDETEEFMPLTVVLAHRLNQKIAELRRSGDLWWARPDSKTQVIFFISIEYIIIIISYYF